MGSSPGGCGGITRRGFLLGAAAGLTAGALPAAWLAYRYHPAILHDLGITPFTGNPAEVPQPELAMPGRYPGRVVQVRDRTSVSPNHVINREAVGRMIDRGMAELTGTDPRDVKAAWGTFFTRGDVVGIKVNPVGRKAIPKDRGGRLPTAIGAISSPEVLVKIIQCLRAVGIPDRDIIVFERYADEFIDTGYADLLKREFPNVRWYASAWSYTDQQLDIGGFDQGRDKCSVEAARHVAGYDPDVFTVMGFCMPEPTHSRHDERRFRSHLSAIVSRMVNKVITIPVLKDHRSAGVTLALKNLSHGMHSNVARSHLGPTAHGFGPTSSHTVGPNQCNTFIPQAVSQRRLREKATLHLLDGLIGVYEGGPGCWNRSWATWRHGGLLFATDPVAMDHVGWDIIDAKRAREGWPPVARMGLFQETPATTVARNLAPLAAGGVPSAAALAIAARIRQDSRGSEIFNLRTPEHVILAGKLGLGTFDREQIAFRDIRLA